MSLDSQRDSSWPLGSFRAGAVEEEPGGAAYEIVGLLDDSSKPVRRGGSTYKSNAAVGSTGLLWVWDGYLAAGQRTMFSSSSQVDVLAADDVTPAAYSLSGTAVQRPIEIGGGMVAFLSGVPLFPLVYAGSRISSTSAYATGTATATQFSAVVTGTGTSWLANADAGMFFKTNGHYGIVKSVDSNTQITLTTPWASATTSAAAYTLFKSGVPTIPSGISSIAVLGSIANRLLAATGASLYVYPVEDPSTIVAGDYLVFPSDIVALATLRDTEVVFTRTGVWAVSGLALEESDAAGNAQWQQQLINADLIAWSREGIAPWRGSLVVPAVDGVWLMDTVSGPVRISDRIADLYLSYVRAGYAPGVAEIFNAHYFLPILDPANSYAWVDTLVCRMQPTLSGGQYAWTQLAGSGAQVRGYAERATSIPKLLGASSLTASRVIDCTSYFQPSAAVKNDADGTTHTWRLTTRNIAIGDRPSGVHHLRGWYSLVDAASDSPTITAEASVDGGSWQTLSVTTGTSGGTTAGAQDGSQAVYWAVGLAGRFIRFRFTCTNPAAGLQFKQLEFFYRTRGN